MSRMLDHVSIQAADIDAAVAFYVDVFQSLGLHEVLRYGGDDGPFVGIAGVDDFPRFWVNPLVDHGTRPIHLAFTAPTRHAVDEVYRRAVTRGVEILHAPRVWPQYHAAYYGVFLRDPDGNNVEAVCHAAE